jgi:hypothetical protein
MPLFVTLYWFCPETCLMLGRRQCEDTIPPMRSLVQLLIAQVSIAIRHARI